jgi:uncharacterized protein (TIGR03382 family)
MDTDVRLHERPHPRSACLAAGLALVTALYVPRATAHGGVPALAVLEADSRCVRVGDAVRLRWREPDFPSVFGESMVEIYTTTTSTRPLYIRERPLTAWSLQHRVSDADPANSFAWQTSSATTGHYFVWSHIVEPAQENADYVAHQAAFVVSVRDDGPTVMLDRPASFSASFGTYRVTYIACSATPGARVRLDAAREEAPDNYFVLADDLPAVDDGTFDWDTRAFEPGRWILRATIVDPCGRSFAAHARGFLEVRPAVDPVDGGAPLTPAATLDARPFDEAACGPPVVEPDAGVTATHADAAADVDICGTDCAPSGQAVTSGCGCTMLDQGSTGAIAAVLLVLAIGRRRERL